MGEVGGPDGALFLVLRSSAYTNVRHLVLFSIA
jgi:hypothetical protein